MRPESDHLRATALRAVCILAASAGMRCGPADAANPPTIYAYDMDVSSLSSRTLMASLAGVVARTSPEVHMAYRNLAPESDPEFWLDRHVENNPGTAVVWQSNPLWFIDRYAPQVSGYVVYDEQTINQATSVAGALGAIMVSESQLTGPIGPALSQAGLTQVEDVRGRSSDWVYDNYSFNRDVIYRQQANKPYQVRSHAVLNNGFVFDETGATRDRFLAGQDDHSVVIGWGFENSETEFFQSAAENNLTTVPADFLQSAAAPSRWEVDVPPRPAKANPVTPTDADNHYVAFVMSDGDNAQWLTNNFATSDRWFGSPHRGSFPMTFDLTPEIAEINPTALKYFYDQAGGDASPTTFVTAGGRGINYPSQQTDFAGYAAATAAAMQRVDHNVVSVLDTVYDTGVLNALAARPEIDGVMFKTNADGYAGNDGEVYWHQGTPVASVRYTLWDGFETPNSLIGKLNAAPRDPLNNVASYSIVNVHPWSVSTAGGGLGDPMSNLAYIASNLAPGVELVTLDELFVHLAKNRERLGGADANFSLIPNGDFEELTSPGADRPADWSYAAGAATSLVSADANGIGSRAAAINQADADWRSDEVELRPNGVFDQSRLVLSFDFQFLGVEDGDGFRADARFFQGSAGAVGAFVGETVSFVDAADYSDGEWHTLSMEVVVPAGADVTDLRFSTYFGGFAAGQVLIDGVSLVPFTRLPGDFNGDGRVSAADYTIWRDSYGNAVPSGAGADANSDGLVGESDWRIWRANFGRVLGALTTAIPEPQAASVAAIACWCFVNHRRCW